MFKKIFFIFFILSLTTLIFASNDRALKKEFEQMKKEKRIALVIGNSNYKSSPLRNPVNDARAMAETLKKLNFEVMLYTNVSQSKMKKAIDIFGRKIRNNNGVGLFYYAGHGMQVRGRNYLIPVNANIEVEDDVEYESIDVGRVLGKMNAANNRLNVVILDACRNNPFSRSFRSGNKGLAQVNAPVGTYIAYATAPGSVAADGRGKNGLFTSKLIKHMNEGIAIEKLFKKVRTDVKRATNGKQIPWTSSSMEGNFYFKLPKAIANIGKTSNHMDVDKDTVFWESISSSSNPVLYEAYLKEFPSGKYKAIAQIRLQELKSQLVKNIQQSEIKKYSLFVNPDPDDARIRILNIVPKYKRGIKLKSGRYHIEVSKSGYEKVKKWITIDDMDKSIEISLKRRNVQQAYFYSTNTYTDPVTGMNFVDVKGGCYEMGDTFGDGKNDEKPVHKVCVDDFYIGIYEVTQRQWKKIMGNNPSKFKSCGYSCPVEYVNWDDVQKFIGKLNNQTGKHFRLPTEAEWEYAARSGGKKEKYSGGNYVNAVAWYKDNSGKKTHRVGLKKANGLGIYDMTGNVGEWCFDRYDEKYYNKLSLNKASEAWYDECDSNEELINNPIGPPKGSYRVVRGGGWNNSARDTRVTNRDRSRPNVRYNNLGFRLVLNTD